MTNVIKSAVSTPRGLLGNTSLPGIGQNLRELTCERDERIIPCDERSICVSKVGGKPWEGYDVCYASSKCGRKDMMCHGRRKFFCVRETIPVVQTGKKEQLIA